MKREIIICGHETACDLNYFEWSSWKHVDAHGIEWKVDNGIVTPLVAGEKLAFRVYNCALNALDKICDVLSQTKGEAVCAYVAMQWTKEKMCMPNYITYGLMTGKFKFNQNNN